MIRTEIQRAMGRDENGRRVPAFVRHCNVCDRCGRTGEFHYGEDSQWSRGLTRAGATAEGFSEYFDGRVQRLHCTDGCTTTRDGAGEG